MADWTDARGADGPALAEWLSRELEAEGRSISAVWGNHGSGARAVNRWKNGECPDFYTVDKYLVQCSLHPMDVPDRIWLAETPKQRAAREGTWQQKTRDPFPYRDCPECGNTIGRRVYDTGRKEKRFRYEKRKVCDSCAGITEGREYVMEDAA